MKSNNQKSFYLLPFLDFPMLNWITLKIHSNINCCLFSEREREREWGHELLTRSRWITYDLKQQQPCLPPCLLLHASATITFLSMLSKQTVRLMLISVPSLSCAIIFPAAACSAKEPIDTESQTAPTQETPWHVMTVLLFSPIRYILMKKYWHHRNNTRSECVWRNGNKHLRAQPEPMVRSKQYGLFSITTTDNYI